MSSRTSASAPWPGELVAPTGTSVTVIGGSPLLLENLSRSACLQPPPNSRMPMTPPPGQCPCGTWYAAQRFATRQFEVALERRGEGNLMYDLAAGPRPVPRRRALVLDVRLACDWHSSFSPKKVLGIGS